METVKTTVGKLKSNIIGALDGAGAGYYAGKKFGKIENKWALIAVTITGAVVGAMVQSKMAAKISVPTSATVKK